MQHFLAVNLKKKLKIVDVTFDILLFFSTREIVFSGEKII
jgi:hypothetical protein